MYVDIVRWWDYVGNDKFNPIRIVLEYLSDNLQCESQGWDNMQRKIVIDDYAYVTKLLHGGIMSEHFDADSEWFRLVLLRGLRDVAMVCYAPKPSTSLHVFRTFKSNGDLTCSFITSVYESKKCKLTYVYFTFLIRKTIEYSKVDNANKANVTGTSQTIRYRIFSSPNTALNINTDASRSRMYFTVYKSLQTYCLLRKKPPLAISCALHNSSSKQTSAAQRIISIIIQETSKLPQNAPTRRGYSFTGLFPDLSGGNLPFFTNNILCRIVSSTTQNILTVVWNKFKQINVAKILALSAG
ncbi:MAG: hypothetical protein LBL41_04810 [Bifidobacteriaceae bacterium]|jgi:hypothetical protein|nr:hypothetical protein [Bifidobacteriaceae bacterium]